MFRVFLLGVLTAIIAAIVGGYFVATNAVIPLDGDAKPLPLEAWAGPRCVRPWSARLLKDPIRSR